MRLIAVALVLLLALTVVPTTESAPQEPPLLGGAPAPLLRGELAMRTYSVDLYRTGRTLDAKTIQLLGEPLEQIILSNMRELGGTGLAGRVSIRFEPAQTGPCAIRGITLSNERTIRLFYGPNADPQRVLAILAHELFHQLQRDYYGERAHRRADVIVLEGMAVWGTRAYFADQSGEPFYRQRTREALDAGEIVSLTTSLERDCRTATRGSVYDQWASFVEFLLTTYGRERFDALYRDSSGRAAGSANYTGVYDKTLTQLEAEWLSQLQTQNAK